MVNRRTDSERISRETSASRDRETPPSPGGFVQLQRAIGNAATARFLSAAARYGLRSPPSALPHLEHIQTCFGHHDIRDVPAHVGPEAEAAVRSLGAVGYATGGHAAFGGAPDIETSAHEAAHVVQQRHGVAGVGAERHADAVAARVRVGRSAEDLLDALPGTAGSAARAGEIVQLREVTSRGHVIHTWSYTASSLYAIVADLLQTGDNDDARAARELLEALDVGEFADVDLADFENDEDEEFELGDAGTESSDEELLPDIDLELPTQVFDRYEAAFTGTSDPTQMRRQNTTAIAVIEGPPRPREPKSTGRAGRGRAQQQTPPPERVDEPPQQETDVVERIADELSQAPDPESELSVVLYGQRAVPGMRELAQENLATVGTAQRAHIDNLHTEMYALFQTMERLVRDGVAERVLQIHPSRPVCFFCEVMLRLFGVRYDESYVSKKMGPKWKDPSRFVEGGEKGHYTPRELLEEFGIDVGEAVERVLPLFNDVQAGDRERFVQRILDGGLQPAELRTMINDLNAASATLHEANQRAKTGTGQKRKRADEEPAGESEPKKSKGKDAEPDADASAPVEIEGVGRVVDVEGSMEQNCLIEAVLKVLDIDFDPRIIRDHLVTQHVANLNRPLDLAGVAGAVLLSFLVQQGALPAHRGLVVHFWARPGELGRRTVVDGGNPIHLWFGNGHFQAILPGGGQSSSKMSGAQTE